jgi:hypothetical protein
MRSLTRLMITISLLAPVISQATVVWSGCQTITAVSNYLANDNGFYLALSPGISGCSAITTGGVGFVESYDGVTSTNINALLATALTAYSAGQQVMIAYDNGTTTCNSQVIAIGGYSAQCP